MADGLVSYNEYLRDAASNPLPSYMEWGSTVITAENVREWFPAPRTENPMAGDPWWQVQGLGLFMALQILRLVPAGGNQQEALHILRQCLDVALVPLPRPPAEEERRVRARTLAPWVPTPIDVVNEMIEFAGLTSDDHLVDLGSGDGRLVFAAAAKGIRATGIEIDEKFVAQCREFANLGQATYRLGENARGYYSYAFHMDPRRWDKPQFFNQDVMDPAGDVPAILSSATVVTCYLTRASMNDLKQTFKRLTPGTRIISHDYAFEAKPGERLAMRWMADESRETKWGGRLYKWIVTSAWSV
jgi:SAM-dependent methyltransferase